MIQQRPHKFQRFHFFIIEISFVLSWTGGVTSVEHTGRYFGVISWVFCILIFLKSFFKLGVFQVVSQVGGETE